MDRHGTTLSLAQLSAEPGTRAFGMVPVDLGAAVVEIPIVLVNGATGRTARRCHGRDPRRRVRLHRRPPTRGDVGRPGDDERQPRRLAHLEPGGLCGALHLRGPPRRSQPEPHVSRRSGRRPDRAPGGLAIRDGHRTLRSLHRLPLRRHERGPRLLRRHRAHRRCGRRRRDRGDGRGLRARLDRGRAAARLRRRPLPPRSVSRPCSARSAARASGRRPTSRSTRPAFVGRCEPPA